MSRRDDKHQAERDRLAEELAGLRIDVQALTETRASAEEVVRLRREKADLEIAKDRIQEESGKKVREAEHKAGLLREKQQQDAEHQTRGIELATQEAVLKVREDSLAAKEQQFDARMQAQEDLFARQCNQFEKHQADLKDLVGQLLNRYPNFDVALTGAIGQQPAAAADEDDEDERPVRRARSSSRSRKDD